MAKVSPSQVKTWDLCNRKWAFRMLERIFEPQSPAAAYGTEGHEVIEHYLKTGELQGADDIVPLVQKAVDKEFLPKPSPELWLEHEFKVPIVKQHLYRGYIDILDPRDEVPLVIDHKFTKDIRWAMSEEELLHDVQAIMYSHFVLETLPKAQEVINRWIYYVGAGSTRPRCPGTVRKVEIVRTRRQVMQLMRPIRERVEQMLRLYRSPKPAMEIVPDLTSCGAYGGCFYKNKCFGDTTFASRFGSRVRQSRFRDAQKRRTHMGLWEKIKAQQAASGAKGVNPEPEAEAPVSDAMAKLNALKASKKKEPPAEEPAPPVEETPPAESAPEPDVVPGDVPTKKATTRKRTKPLIVMFNASVTKNTTRDKPVHLIELLQPIMVKVAEAADVAHYALIEYGGGKPLLAAAFDEFLDADGGWKGTIIVDSASAEASVVWEVLVAHADMIVRGH